MDIWYKSFSIFISIVNQNSWCKLLKHKPGTKFNVNSLLKVSKWWDRQQKKDNTNKYIMNCNNPYSHCITYSLLTIQYVHMRLYGWTRLSTQKIKWLNSNKMSTQINDLSISSVPTCIISSMKKWHLLKILDLKFFI